MKARTNRTVATTAAVLALICMQAGAETAVPRPGDPGLVEGAAGTAPSPWGLMGAARANDYGLRSYGAALGWHERVEVSLQRQDFGGTVPLLSPGVMPFGTVAGQHLRMNILGMKLRVAGDALGDGWMPQVAVGLQYKTVQPGSLGSVMNYLGATTSGTDVYVSATKLFLAQGLLVNATLRASRSGPNALAGFGAAAPGRDDYSLRPEFSVAYLLNRNLAIGAEYRLKPVTGDASTLGSGPREDDWGNIYLAWAPSKSLSLTLAYVGQGRTMPGLSMGRRPSGTYLGAQIAF